MTNIFLENTTYLDEEDLKDSTKIDWLKWTSPEDIENREIYIRKSEIIIDSIIVLYWTKLNPNQNTIFPTVEDWIPVAIQKAVVLISEGIFEDWVIAWGWSYTWEKWVKAEWHWDHKLEFQEQTVQVWGLSKKSKYITQEVEILLRPYISTFSSVKWSQMV